MRYLAPALFREGPTDAVFLGPIILRLLRDVCWTAGVDVELPDGIRELRSLVPATEEPRAERIAAVAEAARGEIDLLFVHADGAGDPGRARAEQIAPGQRLIAARMPEIGPRCVPVVPVRETEAWALADPAALAAVTGIAPVVGLVPERAARVEQITDPKACLVEAVTQGLTARRRRRRSKNVGPWLERLAGRTALERLRDVPSFARCEADTRGALRALGFKV